MTPEETKHYIEQRLRESGWGARIGRTSYEKVFRFTDGTEAGAKQVCYKLLALSSLLPDREVTDDLVEMALDGLTGVDDILKRSSRAAAAGHQDEPGLDRESIDQLAAVLDAKVATGELPKEIAPPPSKLATAKAPARVKAAAGRASPAKTPPAGSRPTPARNGAVHGQAAKLSTSKHDAVFVSNTDRLMPEPRPVVRSTPPPRDSLIERLYQLSSTTTITLSATVLVVITLTMILYINHNVPEAPIAVTRDVGKVAQPPPQVGRITLPEPTPAPLLDKREPVVVKDTEPSPLADADRKSTTATRGAPSLVTPAGAAPPKVASAAATKPSPVPNSAATGATKAPPATVAERSATTAAPAPTAVGAAAVPTIAPKPTQTAATAPTAMPSVVPASRPKISREELTGLLRRFAYVYEAGDVTQFVNLFAENARTNDQTSRQGIRADYEQFFRSTDLRQINLGTVNWEVDENQAQGWGNFDVTVRRQGEQETQTYAGSLSFQVEKVNGRLRIIRLYHGQRRAGL